MKRQFIAMQVLGSWKLLILTGFLVAIVLGACTPPGQGTPPSNSGTLPSTNTTNPVAVTSATPTQPPQLAVKVVSQALVPDLQGALHVVGEIRNESGQAASDIVLTLVAHDAAGASLLRSEAGEPVPEVIFAPLIPEVGSGQTVPFDFALPAGLQTPQLWQVFVSAFTPSTAELPLLQVEHAQVMAGPDGEAVLVGELVNQNAFAVSIGSAAALLRDAANTPQSASAASISPGLLAPAGDSLNQDRAPFKVPFYAALPSGGTWQVYTQAVQSEAVDTSLFAIDQAVNIYTDSRGALHMVSSIRNNAERTFSVQILAALYSSTGSVLDDSQGVLPVDLAAGMELPFDISGFSLLTGRADQQAKLDQYTLQVDAARTQSSTRLWQKLTPEGDQAGDEGQGVWKFSGSVSNTLDGPLQKMVVIAVLKNNSTGALAAVSSAELVNPAGNIEPGVRMDYAIEVLVDPTQSDALKPEVLVFGVGG